MSKTAGWFFGVVGLGLFLCAGVPAMAQLTTGTITGSVTDPSGAAVPGATITVKNVDTGASRSTVSGPTGRYEIASLPTGQYEVAATSTGFQASVRTGIQLTLGRIAVVDHSLQVGEVTQSVTVTGEAPLIETTTATVSAVITAQQIENAPMGSRDLTQLAFLQPGVMKMPAGYGAFSGLGDKITVAGARGNQNLYLLDGVSNSDLSGNPQSASGAYIGAETVKEFQIITNNYSAEYQSAAGAIVSAVTKSGTNTLHGSGFWTTRNARLDANSWTNNRNSAGKRDFARNQFGGSFGGPIIRDKTFFFGSYEGFRLRNNDADTVATWTDAVRAGILPASEGGGTVTVNAFTRTYMELWPRPNTPYKFANDESFPIVRDLGNGTVQILGEGWDRQPVHDDFVGAHFDHMLGEKWGTLSGTYNWDDSDAINSNVMSQLGRSVGDLTTGLTSKKHTIGAKHTGILSNAMVNEFDFGYSFSQAAQDLPPDNPPDLSSLASLAGRTFPAQINAPNGAANVGWRVLGSTYDQTAYQFKEGVSLSSGNHSYRLGTEIKLFRYKQVSCSRGCNGVWGWSNLSSFLQNQPLELEIFQPGHDNPDRLMRQMLFGAYFQDNWQMRPSFTLNLGLRYEFTTVPVDDNGLMSNLINFNDPFVTVTQKVKDDPRYKNDKFMPGILTQVFQNPTLKSFSPRLGFAWAPGSKKLSIRGGAGIFYEYPLLFNIRTALQESPPFVQTGTVNTSGCSTVTNCPATVTTAYANYIRSGGAPIQMRPGVGSDPVFAPLLASTPNIRAFDYNQKNVTIYRWSLTLQRDMGRGMVVSAGYTGSRGVHLWTQNAANVNRWVGWPNQPAGQKTFPLAGARPVANCATLACTAPFQGVYNPSFGVDMRMQSPMADSYFHGLAVGLQQRMSHGMQFHMAYNYSKSIDSGSGVTSTGENFAQGQRGVWFWDMKMKRGLSQFDIRNTLTSNFSYELPGKNLAGVAGALAGGWQINGTLTLLDGHPLSVFDTPTIQRNAIGQSAEQNRANLIAGGNNNPVQGGAFAYYDATQFIPSFCTAIPARIGSIKNALDRNLPICAPGDAEYDPGHFGTTGRNTLTSPGLATFDLSVAKNFNVTENHRVQFRAEFFNFFNRVNLKEPSGNPYDSNGRPNPTFWSTNGQIIDAGLPRTIQLNLKYTF
jgi:hypothetical protein